MKPKCILEDTLYSIIFDAHCQHYIKSIFFQSILKCVSCIAHIPLQTSDTYALLPAKSEDVTLLLPKQSQSLTEY